MVTKHGEFYKMKDESQNTCYSSSKKDYIKFKHTVNTEISKNPSTLYIVTYPLMLHIHAKTHKHTHSVVDRQVTWQTHRCTHQAIYIYNRDFRSKNFLNSNVYILKMLKYTKILYMQCIL